jgi:hypothetical protein
LRQQETSCLPWKYAGSPLSDSSRTAFDSEMTKKIIMRQLQKCQNKNSPGLLIFSRRLKTSSTVLT